MTPMSSEKPDFNLPFFTYGLFRPGEIAFLGIKDFVDIAQPMSIQGSLTLRDGMTLFKREDQQNVKGYLLTFKAEYALKAYAYIDDLEPDKYYKWGRLNQGGKRFNILLGIKPDRGSEGINELSSYEKTGDYSLWSDPYFTVAFRVLDGLQYTPNDETNSEMSIYETSFFMQMKYLFLWTVLERFTFLRYSFTHKINQRNKLLARDKYFTEGIQKYIKDKNRVLYSTQDPDDKNVLDLSNPEKCIKYYYQVRSNITHRGKGVIKDKETIEKSLGELANITKYVIEKTKKECDEVKEEFTH